MSAATSAPELTRPAPAAKRQTRKRRKARRKQGSGPRVIYDIPPVGGPTAAQIAGGRVTAHEWQDPDDLNPNKRTARVIEGYRSADSLTTLCAKRCISRGQAAAGIRFSRAYEMGVLGLEGSATSPLGHIRGSSPDAGPSEGRMAWLERYNKAKARLGKLYDVISGVVEADLSVREYCLRYRLPASATLGRLIAALDVLVDYYAELDGATRATGSGRG